MRQTLILVLLLATVALSSSNVLPLSIIHRDSVDNQNDNTFRHQTRNTIDDLFYKMYVEHQNRPEFSESKYNKMDNNQDDDIFSIMNKNDNYNGEGFRKEQWHNYPRQMDRLHNLRDDKRYFDPDPGNEELSEGNAPNQQNIHDTTNEFHIDSNAGTNVLDSIVDANPLLILKIRLACLNNDVDDSQYADLMSSEISDRKLDEKDDMANENPIVNVVKVKREGVTSTRDSETGDLPTRSIAVNKRIFSLWSRLQSLNHKGHELHHRRHLHAFYGLPDSDGGGGGVLTAEPRAILMRPPGSPLRWG